MKLHDAPGNGGKGKYEKVTYREVLGRLVGEMQGCGSGGDMGAEALMVALKSVLRKLGCLLPQGVTEQDVEVGGKQLGVTMEEMIEMSGLSKKGFEDVYLSWVEGASALNSFPLDRLNIFTSSRSDTFPTIQTRKTRLFGIPSRLTIPQNLSRLFLFLAIYRIVGCSHTRTRETGQINERIAEIVPKPI